MASDLEAISPGEIAEVGSPGWWMATLLKRLDQRNKGTADWSSTWSHSPESRPGLLLLQSWYRGDPPLPLLAKGWQEGFREFLRLSRMNYAELVVEPTRVRMRPRAWRTAAAGDENGDAEALRVARANDFGVTFSDTAKDMLALRDGYMMVGEAQAHLGDVALITSESPLTTITAEDPRRLTRAALKTVVDEWTGERSLHVFVPGQVWVARKVPKRSRWYWDLEASQPLPEGLEDVVPVVRFRNRDDVGEFETHLDVLARINNTILDRVVVSKIQAFRQRAVKGLPHKDPETGEDIDYSGVFAADPGALWHVPENAEFWESAQVQLDPIRMAIKDDVEGLAAVTSTPLHLITPDAASGSAEGASLLREGHVFKVEDRRDRAAGSLARVMALAFRVMGQPERADVSQIETLWEPAERHSLTEKGQAASQLKGVLPNDAIVTDVLQYPPDAVARLNAQRSADLLLQDLADAAAAALSAAAVTAAPPAPAA